MHSVRFIVAFDEPPTPGESRALADQLRRLTHVDEASQLARPSPPGAKSGEAIDWALIGIEAAKVAAPVLLVELVQWLKAWRRRPGVKPVRLRVPLADGGELEIDPGDGSPEELKAAVDRAKAALEAPP